jgi:hypothetical protein
MVDENTDENPSVPTAARSFPHSVPILIDASRFGLQPGAISPQWLSSAAIPR